MGCVAKTKYQKQQISGLWYHELAEEVKKINRDVDELIVYVNANWKLTQADSDTRYQIGREAKVSEYLHEVNEFAESIQNSKHLKKLKKIRFVILHPLLKDGFQSLVKVLNSLPLEEIHIKRPVGIGLPYYDKKDQIHKPVPDRNYQAQQNNWTTRLKRTPIHQQDNSILKDYYAKYNNEQANE